MILRKCDTPVQFLGLLKYDQSALQLLLVQSCPHCERWMGVQNGDQCSMIDDPPWIAGTTRNPSTTHCLISKCCFHHLVGFGARFTELKAKLDTDSQIRVLAHFLFSTNARKHST
ncbi:hypothetical protein TNCV_3188951 [Trichonephila clavipes]|nr:hypothetical protein TNCV_3188951 [Trichonephila clavipes]